MTDDTTICLVLFCRRPAPGQGKQRLAAEIGQVPAATAAELLLAAAVEDLQAWPGPVAVAPADAADCDWAAQLLTRPAIICAQPAGNLGQRLNAVDAKLRAQGLAQLVFIGSDAPELEVADYAAARQALTRADVVLGPARDGGVTLMGSTRPWPDLAALPWSTARLGAELAALCTASGRSVQNLRERADVDVAADLDRAQACLRHDPRPARQHLVRWWLTQGPRSIPGQ